MTSTDALLDEPAGAVRIAPPAMIGILGGGRRSRYFVMAARSMGYSVTVVDPDPQAPAGTIADVHLVAALDDSAALDRVAVSCAVVTTEVETLATEALEAIAHRTILRPEPAALRICQDRISEKQFLADLGVPLTGWLPLVTEADLAVASEKATSVPFPALLKLATPLHEGQQQVLIARFDQVEQAWDKIGRVPCILEQKLRVARELSVIVARTADGRTACYPVAQNLFVKGVIDTTHVPASLPTDGQEQAEQLCTYIAEELGFVGVMAVELFVVGRSVFVNEISPHPHDSGHFTLDAAVTSQYEQQVRAVCGLGLGSPAMSTPGAAMVHLLAELWVKGEPDWSVVLDEPEAHLHLYRSTEPEPGPRVRMGHLTVGSHSALAAASLARRLRTRITPRKG
jgi:5-(carboxyamino)imidazole ribonucleotide synthase